MKKPKHHEVTAEQFKDWLYDQDALFANSTRENKSIRVRVSNGVIIVAVAGSPVYVGIQPDAAIEAYNSITEAYVNPLKDFRI